MTFDPRWHLFFDLLSFTVGSLLFRRELRQKNSFVHVQAESGYWTSLILGAIAGAFVAGSLNLSLSGFLRIGHSIAGALAGGILGVEIFKLRKNVKVSTGFIFVVPILAGITIGRLGCFFSGLADQTFGIHTESFLGINFGDGIYRHPVQLYESLSAFMALIFFIWWRRHAEIQFRRFGFYLFILYYAVQRFTWEFLKPYQTLIGPFNLFHVVCGLLAVYALYMIKESNAKHA